MRILIVGSNSIGAIESYYKRHLSELQNEVEIFDLDQFVKNGYIYSVIRFIFPDILYYYLNKCLLKRIKANEFDVIWVFKVFSYLNRP